MAEDFFELSPNEKREVLAVASTKSGRPSHLLEKDVWVVWALRELFASKFGEHLIFKGGTSLSKAYQAINRFSEDVDITYDIRAIAPDLVEGAPDALPGTRSQQKKWTDEIRARLGSWVAEEMLPYLSARLAGIDKDAVATGEGDTIDIAYRPVAQGTGYVAPNVRIEFGARSTGEPHELRKITADAAAYVSDVTFPECEARTMLPERTFWEKATAAHVYCLQGELGGDRFSRHWSDLVKLDDAGIAERAIKDRELANAVAAHKTMFFREKGMDGNVIDYHAAVSGHLKLVPEGKAGELLAADYGKMLEDGLLPEGARSFDQILERCAAIEKRANRQ